MRSISILAGDALRLFLMIRTLAIFAVSICALAQNPEWATPFPGHRIIGNLYYVGTYDLTSYLIVLPPAGLIFLSIPRLRDAVPLIEGQRRVPGVQAKRYQRIASRHPRPLRSHRIRHGRTEAHHRREIPGLLSQTFRFSKTESKSDLPVHRPKVPLRIRSRSTVLFKDGQKVSPSAGRM